MSGLQLAFKAEDLFLGVPDPITLTLSVLVLLVSAASALAAWRANSRQSQRQERLVNIETAREQDRGRGRRAQGANHLSGERRRLEAHRQPLDERWRRAVRRWKASYDEVAAILESKPYRFARTMPECPHWYTLWTSWTADGTEDAWTDELDRLWGCVVGHIRIYGVPEQYVAPDGHTWWGTYLYANDWKYWTMGTPVEQTILINRTNQEIDGGPLRRPDRWTLETLGATEMLAHVERQGLLAAAPSRARPGR